MVLIQLWSKCPGNVYIKKSRRNCLTLNLEGLDTKKITDLPARFTYGQRMDKYKIKTTAICIKIILQKKLLESRSCFFYQKLFNFNSGTYFGAPMYFF